MAREGEGDLESKLFELRTPQKLTRQKNVHGLLGKEAFEILIPIPKCAWGPSWGSRNRLIEIRLHAICALLEICRKPLQELLILIVCSGNQPFNVHSTRFLDSRDPAAADVLLQQIAKGTASSRGRLLLRCWLQIPNCGCCDFEQTSYHSVHSTVLAKLEWRPPKFADSKSKTAAAAAGIPQHTLHPGQEICPKLRCL